MDAQVALFAERFLFHDERFSEFLATFEPEKSPLLEKRYRVRDTGLSYRVAQTWVEAGILVTEEGETSKSRQWKSFSIVDVFLIRIFMKLRSFGVSLARLEDLQMRIGVMNLARLMRAWTTKPKEGQVVTEHAYLVYTLHRIASGDDMVLVAMADGQAHLGDRRGYVAALHLEGKNGMGHHIVVNLTEVACEMLPGLRKAHAKRRLDVRPVWLTPKERALLALVRGGTYESVTVKAPDGKIDTLTTVDTVEAPNETTEALMAFVAENLYGGTPYGDLHIAKKDGHPVSIVRTQKIRPDP